LKVFIFLLILGGTNYSKSKTWSACRRMR